jgi:hypothetical protein
MKYSIGILVVYVAAMCGVTTASASDQAADRATKRLKCALVRLARLTTMWARSFIRSYSFSSRNFSNSSLETILSLPSMLEWPLPQNSAQ